MARPESINPTNVALDPSVNFAKAQVSTGYDADDTSIVLESGHGSRLPAPSFNVVWWNATDYPDPADDPNREIVRVTAKSTDTLTVTRAQEGTSASTKNEAGKTYLMIAGPTAKTMTDIEAEIANAGGVLTSTLTLPPFPVSSISTGTLSSTTTAQVMMFTLPMTMTINKISWWQQGAPTSGTADIGIYSVDGQTKHIDVTTATISAQGLISTSVSSVELPAGEYYVVIVLNSGSLNPRTIGSFISDFNDVTSEPKYAGTLTVTAGTLPTTFDPTTLTAATSAPLFRLDS